MEILKRCQISIESGSRCNVKYRLQSKKISVLKQGLFLCAEAFSNIYGISSRVRTRMLKEIAKSNGATSLRMTKTTGARSKDQIKKIEQKYLVGGDGKMCGL